MPFTMQMFLTKVKAIQNRNEITVFGKNRILKNNYYSDFQKIKLNHIKAFQK